MSMPSIDEVRQMLTEDEVLIEYYTVGEEICASSLRQGQKRKAKHIGRKNQRKCSLEHHSRSSLAQRQ